MFKLPGRCQVTPRFRDHMRRDGSGGFVCDPASIAGDQIVRERASSGRLKVVKRPSSLTAALPCHVVVAAMRRDDAGHITAHWLTHLSGLRVVTDFASAKQRRLPAGGFNTSGLMPDAHWTLAHRIPRNTIHLWAQKSPEACSSVVEVKSPCPFLSRSRRGRSLML